MRPDVPRDDAGSCGSGQWRWEGRFIRARRSTTTEPLLVDTNVLLAATDEKREHHSACMRLLESQPGLRISTQIVREYLAVATRPVEANGLGLPVAAALENVRAFRSTLRLLPEEKPILSRFLALLEEVPCQGKRIHDAHVVATAIVHRVRMLVTLNAKDFEAFAPRISAVTPAALVHSR